MTTYIKDGLTFQSHELRTLFQNVSLPEGGDMTGYGYSKLVETPPPAALPDHYVDAGPVVAGAQTWVQVLIVPTVPESVSPRQLRQALTRVGLRVAVEAAVAAGDQDTKDWYEWATLFERQHPAVVGMGAALGQSDEHLDALFLLAASL